MDVEKLDVPLLALIPVAIVVAMTAFVVFIWWKTYDKHGTRLFPTHWRNIQPPSKDTRA